MMQSSTDAAAKAEEESSHDENEDHFPEPAPEPREKLTKTEASQMVTELLTFPYNNTIEIELERETEILKGELQLDGEDGSEVKEAENNDGKEAKEDEEQKDDPFSSEDHATDDEDSSKHNHQTLLQKLLPDPPLLTVPKIPKLVERTDTDNSGPLAQIAAIPSFDTSENPDRAHSFQTQSYKKPTYCGICDGLLVGIIRQGMRCQQCGMNVHHGEGKGEHDDCKAEALLQACRGECCNENENLSPREELKQQNNRRQSSAFPDWQQIQDMFRNHPNLWEDFAEQTEKDFMKNISQAIIEQGADNERTRKIKRARELVIKPTLHKLESVETLGIPLFPLVWLLYYQIIALLVVAVVTAMIFSGILTLIEGGATREGVLLYTSTVGVSIQVGMVVVALLLRFLSQYFKRKEIIVDNFLQQAFTVQADQDFGVSIQEFANILRRWSDRFVVTNVVMLIVAVMMWYKAEEAFTKAVMEGLAETLQEIYSDDSHETCNVSEN